LGAEILSTELPSLAARLEKEGALPWREAARLAARIARLLDRLHARGTVHGGIEPLTVLFVGGAVRLADPLPAERRQRGFVAPAALAGAAAGRQADFHALGRLIEAMLAVDHERSPVAGSPPGRAAAVPAPLAAVVARLVGQDPDAGYRSGNDVAAALELAMAASEAFEESRPVTATAAPPPPSAPLRAAPTPTRRPSRRARHGLLVAGLLALLAGGSVATLMLLRQPPGTALDGPPPVAGEADDNDGGAVTDTGRAGSVEDDIEVPADLPPTTITRAEHGERLAALLTDLPQRPCTRLEVETGPSGTRLQGNVATAADRLALIDAIAAAGPVAGVAADVMIDLAATASHCRLFDLLAAASEAAVPRLVSLYPSRASHRLTEAEPLIVEVLTPAFPSYLTVDYFAADGMVVHLMAGLGEAGPRPPFEVVKVGDPRDGRRLTIAPPFGDEVILAIASAEPLFAGPRAMIEPAGSYLDDLEAALTAMPEAPLASTIVIRTRPKGLRHAAP